MFLTKTRPKYQGHRFVMGRTQYFSTIKIICTGMPRIKVVEIFCNFESYIWSLSCACCIFWPAFGCWALQMLVPNMFFLVFGFEKLKKEEKERKLRQIKQINVLWEFAPISWSKYTTCAALNISTVKSIFNYSFPEFKCAPDY